MESQSVAKNMEQLSVSTIDGSAILNLQIVALVFIGCLFIVRQIAIEDQDDGCKKKIIRWYVYLAASMIVNIEICVGGIPIMALFKRVPKSEDIISSIKMKVDIQEKILEFFISVVVSLGIIYILKSCLIPVKYKIFHLTNLVIVFKITLLFWIISLIVVNLKKIIKKEP